MTTLKDLRRVAKNIGMKGYSKLKKAELEEKMAMFMYNSGMIVNTAYSNLPANKSSSTSKVSSKPKRKVSSKPKRKVSRKPKRKVSRKPKSKTSRKPKRKVSRKLKMGSHKSRNLHANTLSPKTGKKIKMVIKETIPKSEYRQLAEPEMEEMLDDMTQTESQRTMIKNKLKILVQTKIPKDFVSQYFTSYEKRVKDAYQHYISILQEIPDDIQGFKEYAQEEGTTYSKKKELEDIKYLHKEAKKRLNRNLKIAKSYVNDFENYAYALLVEWQKSGRGSFP